ncbi:MAG: GTPBP1 family GTP-binding protein [Methanocellales archaeon]
MNRLETIIRDGERENIEFKEFLDKELHLKGERKQNLACQMKHRILMGNGSAVYVIGVADGGKLKGISRERFDETLSVLSCIAIEIGARIADVEEYRVDGGFVGLVTINNLMHEKEHILIGTAGHVDHGKSTLVGSLVTGICDDGDGKTRIYLDVLPHEVERGLSAELSYGVYGFKQRQTLRLVNPLNKKERAGIVEQAEKIVSFVDTVGHEPWLRTTIRGIVGQKLDYGLLVVAADDGVTHVTKEHLGILIAMDLPVIIAITKIDRASEEQITKVEQQISNVLKLIGKIPFKIKTYEDIDKVAHKIAQGILTPMLRTSSVTLEGYDLLDRLLYMLPKRNFEIKKPFQMYIDKIYQITGVGTVASGTVKQGEVRTGDLLYLGPDEAGSFQQVKVQSIEMHYYRIDKASAGEIVGIALKGVKASDIARGMVLCKEEPKAVREFQAEVLILNHPTRIARGYEPVLHVETIAETVVFEDMDREYMMAGQSGRVKMRFKFKPHYIYEGQKFIFREGRSKGIGKVVKVID